MRGDNYNVGDDDDDAGDGIDDDDYDDAVCGDGEFDDNGENSRSQIVFRVVSVNMLPYNSRRMSLFLQFVEQSLEPTPKRSKHY